MFLSINALSALSLLQYPNYHSEILLYDANRKCSCLDHPLHNFHLSFRWRIYSKLQVRLNCTVRSSSSTVLVHFVSDVTSPPSEPHSLFSCRS